MAKYDRYMAKAISGEFGTSAKKGTPFVGVTFEVTQGDAKGTKFPWDGYLTDATSERTVQSLRLCGCTFPGDDITNLAGLGSKEVEIQVEDTEFGKRVAWVNEPKTSSVNDENKMNGGAKKALAAQFKGTLLALKGGGMKAAVQKSNAASLDTDPFATTPASNDAHGEPQNDTAVPLAATGTDGVALEGGVLTQGGKELF